MIASPSPIACHRRCRPGGRAGAGSRARMVPTSDRRDDEGGGVGQDGQRGRGGLHQGPGHRRPGDAGGLPAHGQLAVALHQTLPTDERGQVGGVGHLGQHGERADQEGQRVQQLQTQHARGGAARGMVASTRPWPRSVATSTGRRGRRSIHVPAGQTEQEHGERLRRREPPHLPRPGPQGDRRQGQREQGDLRARQGDRLAHPQLHEVGRAPQPRGAAFATRRRRWATA